MKRVFAHIGFSFGVTLVALNALGAELAKYAALVILAVFAASLIIPKYRQAASVPVCAGSALLACFLFLYAYYNIALPQLSLNGKSADAVFYLTGLGESTKYGYKYPAKVISVAMNGAPQSMKVYLYTKEQIPAAGYQLLEGKLRFYDTAQNGFSSFGAWGRGVFVNAKSGYITRTDEFVSSPMRKILEYRYYIAEFFENKVGGDAGALSVGVLTGDRSHMSDELNNAFKMTGTTHLTAVSGMHLSAVTGTFAYLFKKTGISKKISAPVLIAIIVFYSMLSGFSKSVLRAGIMLTLVLIGDVIERRADSMNSLGFALFLICCVNPFAVCDVSTLFTVVSMLAIIGVYPLLEERHYKRVVNGSIKRKPKSSAARAVSNVLLYILNMLILSACISICCLPINCIMFGYFSLVGMFLNVIILPLGTVAVILSMLSVILSVPLGTGFVNTVIIKLVTACANLPFAAINTGETMVYIIASALILIGVAVIIAPKSALKTAVFCAVYTLAAAITLDVLATVDVTQAACVAVLT